MSKRIMVVDDSELIRQILGVTLRDAGFEVVEADNGVDALLQMERESVDLLITDLHMPRLDGVGLIANVRRKAGWRYLPIVMLTSETEEHFRTSAERAGASAWLNKPVGKDQLLGLVGTILV